MSGFADAIAALQESTDNFEQLRQKFSKKVIEEAIALRGQGRVRQRKTIVNFLSILLRTTS